MTNNPNEPIYTVANLIEVMECNRIFYNGWVARGLLKPSIPSKGAGNPSRWSLNDILAAKITKLLGESGTDLRTAQNWATVAAKIVGEGKLYVDLINKKPYYTEGKCPSGLTLVIDTDILRKEIIDKLDI